MRVPAGLFTNLRCRSPLLQLVSVRADGASQATRKSGRSQARRRAVDRGEVQSAAA
jgi:hypothetical protein